MHRQKKHELQGVFSMATTTPDQTQKPQPAAAASAPPPAAAATPAQPPAAASAPAQPPASDRSFKLPADDKHLSKPETHHSHIHHHHHHEAHPHQPAGYHTHHPETVPHHNPTSAAPSAAAPAPKPAETPSKQAETKPSPPSAPVKPADPPAATVKSANPSTAETSKLAAVADPLKSKAERLLKAAHRAATAAKKAGDAGIKITQNHSKHIADFVTENAHASKESSKVFLSKVASKFHHKAAAVKTRAASAAAAVAETYPRSAEEPERVCFPLSILLWCSTLCCPKAGAPPLPPSPDAHVAMSREPAEMEAEHKDEDSESFPPEFLASAADEYSAALEQHAIELEDAIDARAAVHTTKK